MSKSARDKENKMPNVSIIKLSGIFRSALLLSIHYMINSKSYQMIENKLRSVFL